MYRPVVFAILDGWGCREETYGNAIAAAAIPHWHAFFDRYPWTMLSASGESVGMPAGVMGNSEVGHLNLGAGRTVQQGVVVINADIESGVFGSNETLQRCIAHVKRTDGTLHLMGLLSDGQVHSTITHLFALIDAAVDASVPFAIHVFPDGRDTPPRSAERFVNALEEKLDAVGRPGAIASVIGRFYAMDRDKRWERTEQAYDALARGQAAQHEDTALAAIRAGYERGESDEFIVPTIVGEPRPIRDGDACVYFNFRPDRARALTLCFNGDTSVPFAKNAYANLIFATMVRYDEGYANPVLFGPRQQHDTFGDVVSRAGLHQLRIAETEKYAHVTYFFNGGREDVLAGEDRELIASNRSVETYDLAPEMRAKEITAFAVNDIRAGAHDVIVMNYANADMIGHTGKWEPTIESVEVLDECLQRLADAVLAAGGLLAITADHGNAEEKIDKDGNPLTAHTTNPVPFILIADGLRGRFASGGKLGDVAPTILGLMDLPVPPAMTGRNLFTREG